MQHLRVALLLAAACQATLALEGRQSARSPVEKVVTLLKDLKSKIEGDGQSEQQSYDKYACWCEKTTKRKADAITAAQDSLRELGQAMLTLKGQVATLIAELEENAAAIKLNKKMQEQLTANREKSNSEYTARTTEMKEVLTALEKAIIVLQDGTKPSSFLQQGSAASVAVRSVIDALPSQASLKPQQLVLLNQLMAKGGGKAGYAPQSWTVQGLLRDMYSTFAADLESATATEATENRQFEDLIAEKTKQLKDLEKTRARKEQEKAEAETLLADKTQTYDDTQAQMKADIEFFDETKAACKSKHDDWTTRKDLRTEELKGISDALEILTSDEARELFATTIKAGKETNVDDSLDAGVSIASLLQTQQDKSSRAPPMKAYASLKDSATRSHSLRLAALAVRVREAKVGHFDEVLKSIDTMITTLKEEDAADIEKRDQCIEEYKKTNSTIANIEWLIRKNVAKIDKLERLIEKLEQEKAQTIQDIDDINAEMAAMLEQRKAENAEFLNSKENDQKAIKLLVNARAAMSKYYKKNEIEMGPIQGNIKGLSLSQQGPDFEISADQAPDASFSGKGKRKNESKGIIQLFTMIIEDLSDEIKNSMKAEELAQLDYEKQLASAMKLNDTLTERKTNLETMIGKRTQERDDEDTDKTNNEADLKAETDYRAEITPDCDWIIGAFSQRATRRTAEMEGLTQAKEYLAGYSPSGSSLISEKTSRGTGLPSVRSLALSH